MLSAEHSSLQVIEEFACALRDRPITVGYVVHTRHVYLKYLESVQDFLVSLRW